MILETILGGVTGLIGNIVTGVVNYKTRKLEVEHEQKMVELETKAMLAEAEANIKVTKAQVEGAVELADSAAYMESIKQGNKPLFSERWVDNLFKVEGWARFIAVPAAILVALLFGFVDWLRGLMRPALTMYLTGMTTYITLLAWKIMQEHGIMTLGSEGATEIFNHVISIVIYLTVSCVTWWFGDRRIAKFLTQMHNKNNGQSVRE